MFHSTGRAVGFTTAVVFALLARLIAGAATPTPAQEAAAQKVVSGDTKTVWDGVYTAEQAARGRETYERICAECHSTGEAPAIVGNIFLRRWFEDNLNVPFTKMRTAMPDDAPGTLPVDTYVDVLSYLLQAGGFPAGAEPLTADSDRLARILIVDRGGPGGPVPNFSLVQLVGCLAQDADGNWILTNSTSPARTREPGASPPADLQVLAGSALGAQTFHLLAVVAQHRDLKGHKVLSKGLLNRTPTGDRLNLTAVQSLAESCPK